MKTRFPPLEEKELGVNVSVVALEVLVAVGMVGSDRGGGSGGK